MSARLPQGSEDSLRKSRQKRSTFTPGGSATSLRQNGERADRSKRLEIYWRHNETWTVRRLNTLFAPVGFGYYGVSAGEVALGYHVAEIVYYLSRAVEGVELRLSETSCVAEVMGELVGVVDDQILMPGGGTIQSAYPFEKYKFFGEFRHALSPLPRSPPAVVCNLCIPPPPQRRGPSVDPGTCPLPPLLCRASGLGRGPCWVHPWAP